MNDTLTRIGIFYDGNFFHVVNNYYAYQHGRKSRISLNGLHEFIRQRVAREERVEARLCRVVDVHYFRGRFSADEANEAGKLYSERVFDDVLIRQGVTTHYLPMGHAGTEKGVDVWFALEAYELAIYKRFDVCVLIAGDSDYVPLARKLNTLGTRVMVVGWDFEYVDRSDRLRTTKTSLALLNEVTYPVLLSDIIEDGAQEAEVDELFLPSAPKALPQREESDPSARATSEARHAGRIENLLQRDADDKRYGFISPEGGGENLWFGDRDLDGVAFSELSRGDAVTFEVGRNWQGDCARSVRRDS